MLARDYWRAVTVDRSDLLDRFLAVLREHGAAFCVIGGQGVNAYAEPVVSLDLDIVIGMADLGAVEADLRRQFTVERLSLRVVVAAAGSDLRVQIQTDPRYAPFIGRATERTLLRLQMPVAAIEDLLQGKVWAADDSTRRASKRQKDLADIARLLEAAPDLRSRIPESILNHLL